MEGSGQGRQLLEMLRDREAILLSALSPSHSTAGRRMSCDLVNRMPCDASPPHVETGARSSMLRNNKGIAVAKKNSATACFVASSAK